MFAICVFALISLSSIPVTNGLFCDSMNSISSVFSIGKYIYISQGINTIWKFDLKSGSVLDKKHTIDDIFGTGLFESVDTAFSFDFNACVGRSSAKCEIIGKAKNIALAIGERKEVSDDKYGYYAFRVNDESLLRLVGNDFSSVWGLSSGQTFNQNSTHESFWIKGNDFIYVGSAFDRNQNILYFMVNKIDDKSNGSKYHLLTRKLEESGLWSEWKDKEMPKYNGIFSANGLIYGVDGNDMIESLGLNNGELNVKRIVISYDF